MRDITSTKEPAIAKENTPQIPNGPSPERPHYPTQPPTSPLPTTNIIDLTFDEPADPSPTPAIVACTGYVVPFTPKPRQLLYTLYPFGLHGVQLLPWDCSVTSENRLVVRAWGCDRTLQGQDGIPWCNTCGKLSANATLAGIVERMEMGVHENSRFEYHGFGGVWEMLRRKNSELNNFKLKGLNQTKRILSATGELDEQKRLLKAVASHDINRISQVLRVAIARRRGVAGTMQMLEAAAEGVYKPHGYTESETMRALLTWKLAGDRVATINHRSRGDPSITYLRSRSFTPPIKPSIFMPDPDTIAENILAAYEPILETVHQSVGNVVHVVLMLDEIAVEKRIRWDPRTNMFLGVCREHANEVDMEFLDETVMKELFKALDSGKVHYATEVGIFPRMSRHVDLIHPCPRLQSAHSALYRVTAICILPDPFWRLVTVSGNPEKNTSS